MGKNNLQINLFSKKRVNIMNLSKEGSSSNWNLIVNPRWKKERKHFSKVKLSFCAGAAATPLIISFFFFLSLPCSQLLAAFKTNQGHSSV